MYELNILPFVCRTHPRFGAQRYIIKYLHSNLSVHEQREALEVYPLNSRKIVLVCKISGCFNRFMTLYIKATSIAELSLTIEDVVFVVDCGKVKEMCYYAVRQI